MYMKLTKDKFTRKKEGKCMFGPTAPCYDVSNSPTILDTQVSCQGECQIEECKRKK